MRFYKNNIKYIPILIIGLLIGICGITYLLIENKFSRTGTLSLQFGILFLYLGNFYLFYLLLREKSDLLKTKLQEINLLQFLSSTVSIFVYITTVSTMFLYTVFWVLRVGPVDVNIPDTMLRAKKLIIFSGGLLFLYNLSLILKKLINIVKSEFTYIAPSIIAMDEKILGKVANSSIVLKYKDSYLIKKIFYYGLIVVYGLSVLSCIALIAYFSYEILHNAGWILSDDHQFIASFLSGNYWNPAYNWGSRRFTPFVYFEYNPLVWIGDRPDILYLYIAIKFLVLFFVLWLILKKVRNIVLDGVTISNKKIDIYNILIFIFIVLFILSPYTFITTHAIFSEQSLILLLALFIYFLIKYIEHNKNRYFILSLIFINLALYFKEPTASIPFTIAFIGLVFVKNKTKKDKLYYSLLLLSTLIFFLLYYFLVFSNYTGNYAANRSYGLTRLDMLQNIIKGHNILIINFVILLLKLPILFKGNKYDKMSYSLLLSSLAFTVSYIIIGLQSARYFSPIYILSMPAIFYFIIKDFRNNALCKKLISIILLSSLFTIYSGSFEQLKKEIGRRQKAYTKKEEVISTLKDFYNEGYSFVFYTEKVVEGNLHINATEGWRRGVLNKFLTYEIYGYFKNEDSLISFVRDEQIEQIDYTDTKIIFLVPNRIEDTNRLDLMNYNKVIKNIYGGVGLWQYSDSAER